MSSHPPLAAAILAAGKGTRMKSATTPKVLHTLAGRSMILHVLHNAVQLVSDKIYPIVGHQGEQVQAHVQALAPETLTQRIHWVEQREQLGTGHAIQQLLPHLENFSGHLVILTGDAPLLRPETLSQLWKEHLAQGNAATLLTTILKNPFGYGRIIKDNAGHFIGIREHKDCDADDLAIREVNTGIYLFDWTALQTRLPQLKNDNAKGEYYLTDILGMLVKDKQNVGISCLEDADEVRGINSRQELSEVEDILLWRIRQQWMNEGVTLRQPESIYLGCEIELAQDVEILPGTSIEGQSKVASGSVIGPNSQLKDAHVGQNCVVQHSVMNQAKIGNEVQVGPFAHLRPKADLGDQVKIGNFVELKNTRMGNKSKASHLSYLGDAVIGEDCNVGAGTITCNYDGANKHVTTLEDDVFIGSNSTLVAPLTVERSGYVGAGSVITKDIPSGALGIGRGRQDNKLGWVERRRPRKS